MIQKLQTDDVKKSTYVINEILKISNFKVIDNIIRIYELDISEGEISRALILNGVLINRINKKEQNLEEYFMKIINGGGISV